MESLLIIWRSGRPHNLAERAPFELVKTLSADSDAFLDVGANEGLFGLVVATSVFTKRRDRIHLFEPDADLCARLSTNFDRNDIRANIGNVAVGDRIGRASFHRNLTDDSSGSLTQYFVDRHETVVVDVNVITLASYLETNGIYGACVKVDVEGAGVAVWDGMCSALDRVKWLVIEIIGPETTAGLPRKIIRETGWSAYYIRDYDLIGSIDGEFDYVSPHYSWLFCRPRADELAFVLRETPFRVSDAGASGECV